MTRPSGRVRSNDVDDLFATLDPRGDRAGLGAENFPLPAKPFRECPMAAVGCPMEAGAVIRYQATVARVDGRPLPMCDGVGPLRPPNVSA
jgi:hypothetical protein